jgi:hypothetical protein
MEKIVLSKIGPYGNDWAIVYADPNNTYSAGGGRLTVVVDSYVGSAFFSHVSNPTFNEFLAGCNPGYLIKKLFQLDKWVPVESGDELIEYIARERMNDIKEYRSKDGATKDKLRDLYNELQGLEFTNTSHLHDILDKEQRDTLGGILGEDWWWDSNPNKLNHAYTYLDSILTSIILKFKEKVA